MLHTYKLCHHTPVYQRQLMHVHLPFFCFVDDSCCGLRTFYMRFFWHFVNPEKSQTGIQWNVSHDQYKPMISEFETSQWEVVLSIKPSLLPIMFRSCQVWMRKLEQNQSFKLIQNMSRCSKQSGGSDPCKNANFGWISK